MGEIITIYKKSINKNLKDIASILKQLNMDNPYVISSCRHALKLSSGNVTKKWLSGRKYIRTAFVKEAFSKYYPEKYIEMSMLIDAMVNILDDLIDEKIDDKEKCLYILELLRVFSLYSLKKPEEKIQTAVGHCFDKLILIAITEDIYKKMIAKEKRAKKIVKYSIENFYCRSMDIDVFNEIALVGYRSSNGVEKIKQIGRIFRAVNIIKKDIEDIEYDREKGMETIVTHMAARKDQNFPEYIEDLLNYFVNKANKIRSSVRALNIKIRTPVNNYYGMIEKDKKKIIKIRS